MKETRELTIAEQLLHDGVITEDQLWVWKLHKEGLTFYRIRAAVRRSASTCWRWYQLVQGRIEDVQAKETGLPLAGVTIFRGGAGATETPFMKDPCLTALGF